MNHNSDNKKKSAPRRVANLPKVGNSGEQKNLVPKLKFPEFRNDGQWKEKTLGELTYPISEKNKEGKKYPIYSINNIAGFLPQSEQFDGVDSHDRGYDISLYKIIGTNTFAYNPARINVGSIGYSGDLEKIIISSLYVCFKTQEDLDDLFLLQFLKTNVFAEAVKNNAEGGIRNYLFYENFSRINVYLPSLPEQQKIASCLSSLDEMLDAESQKLQALKAHKKGLMQQLFPVNGQITPILRFPEFRESGEWKEKRLGQIADIVTGTTPNTKESDNYDGSHLFVSPADISEDVRYITNTKTTLSDKGALLTREIKANSVLFVCIGSTIGKVAQNKIQCSTNQQINSLIPHDNYSTDFLYSILEFKANEIAIIAGKQAVPIINKSLFSSLSVPVPCKAEQQKIASCLSSLDELIAAQAEKIEGLKRHKKGLISKRR